MKALGQICGLALLVLFGHLAIAVAQSTNDQFLPKRISLTNQEEYDWSQLKPKAPVEPPKSQTNAAGMVGTNFPYATTVALLSTGIVSGVLSDPNYRQVIHALEQRTKVDFLPEPEQPVAASGRGENRIALPNFSVALSNAYSPPSRQNTGVSFEYSKGYYEPTVGGLVQDGRRLYEQGRLDGAEAKFKAALAADSNNADAKYYWKLVQAARQGPENGIIISNRQLVELKLNHIRIPNVSFDHLSLREVASQLSEATKQYDPEKIGVKIMTTTNSDSSEVAEINSVVINKLVLTDVRLADVLDAIVLVADKPVRYSILENSVVFSAKTPDEIAKASKLFTRTFRIDLTVLRAGLVSIRSQSFGGHMLVDTNISTLSPTEIGREFLAGLGVNWQKPPGKSVTYNEQLGVLVVTATEDDLDTIERAIEVLNDVKPQLFTRTIPIDLATLRDMLSAVEPFSIGSYTTSGPNASTLSPAEIAEKFFTTIGLDFKSSPGKSISYNDQLGALVVTATEKDLNIIEIVLATYCGPVPQIHIKVRFVEVPKETMSGMNRLQNVTNILASSCLTGVLNAENFKTVIHALEARNDVKFLAEPEVTTTSGRQVQMRATQIITVIANFAFHEEVRNGVLVTNSITPEPGKFEIGPILDVVPYVISDGYTINLAIIPSLMEFLGYDRTTNTATAYSQTGDKVDLPKNKPRFEIHQSVACLNVWDDQTVVLGGLPEIQQIGRDKELLIFVTATIVDPAGNQVHSDADMKPFLQKGLPLQKGILPQPSPAMPGYYDGPIPGNF